MQCKAKSKRSQQPCQRRASRGREVCYIHGGKSPIGPGSPHFRTGKYSKFLPSRMAADAEASLKDETLLELRDAIAATDARIIDLLKRVDAGEAGSLWRQAQEAFAKMRMEESRKNIDGMMIALSQAERYVSQGANDYAAWDELSKQFELRRKLCDSENRRLTQAHEVLNMDQAMLLLTQTVQIIQRHVTDRKVLAAIAADMQGTVLMRQGQNGYE